MRFVGVSTGSSSIMTVFPRWSQMLGLGADLVGLDVPLDSSRETYRDVVRTLRDDPLCVGALVTTHKIALHDAALDMFDELDEFAREVGEISSVAVADGRVRGAAKDPVTAGLALEAVIPPDHFARGGHVLCLGGGGAGTAIGWYLARRADAPAEMTVADTSPARLAHMAAVVRPRADRTVLHAVDPRQVDVRALVAALPDHSLVVNATGLGKDRPGSPLPDDVELPRGGVVWELNYRGSLELLHQARAQQAERGLVVVDGWDYFVHGWSQVVADVFGLDLDEATVRELSRVAAEVR